MLSVSSQAWPTLYYTYRDLQLLGQSSVLSPLRVIALIDYDAFYAQCESVRLGLPAHKPLGVRQWNAIIALNYPAREVGLKRGVSVDNARVQCPNIVLQHVATWREGEPSWAYRSDVEQHLTTDKAALDPYRLQSRRTLELVKKLLPAGQLQTVEKASVDEIFLDLSRQVHQILLERYPNLLTQQPQGLDSNLPDPDLNGLDWHTDKIISPTDLEDVANAYDWDDVAFSIGSEIVHGLREQIFKELHYTCSAGVARNKMLAKLAAGQNKPDQQTVVRNSAIPQFLSSIKVTKIRGLGRQLGMKVKESFDTDHIPDLLHHKLGVMQSRLGSETGQWVFDVIRGVEHSHVIRRTLLQRMLSAKTFNPSITSFEQAIRWLRIFAADLHGRLDEVDATSIHRRPRTIALHHHINGRFGPTRSKQSSIPLARKITPQTLLTLAQALLVEIAKDGPTWPCMSLSVSVANFKDDAAGNFRITSYLDPQSRSKSHQELQSSDLSDPSRHLHIPLERGEASGPSDHPAPHRKQTGLELDLTEAAIDAGDQATSCQSPTVGIVPPISPPFSELHAKYCCPRCGENIAGPNVLEHLDWHVALDIQQAER